MKPIKNPNILIVEIDEDFSAVVNLHINDGVKVINKNQLKVLLSIDGKKTIKDLASEFDVSEEDIILLCDLFAEKEIINFSGKFSHPERSKNPTSMNFWVHTTNSCNLRCEYCYIHTLGGTQKMTDEVISRFMDKIIETVKSRKLKRVVLRLAGGEPFLEIKKWASHLHSLKRSLIALGCEYKTIFLTNLVILTDDILQFIKDEDAGVAVSLDGLGKYQDQSRHFPNGQGSFSFVEKNINKLIEQSIYPSIMTVISNNNLDGLLDFTQYLIDKKLKFRYSFVQDEELDIGKLTNVLEQCYHLMEVAIEEKNYPFSWLHSLCDIQFVSVAFTTCGNGFSIGALYPDGDIYFCQKNFGLDISSGSIFEDDDLISIIQRKTYYNSLPLDCQTCLYRYHCMGGCPLERGDNKDPHCDVYKIFFPLYYKLYGKERLLKIIYNCIII